MKLCKIHTKIVFLFFLIKQSRLNKQNMHLIRVEYENEIMNFFFRFILPSQGLSKTQRAFLLAIHLLHIVSLLLLCRPQNKISISQKERNLHSKYLFPDTRVLLLESSCFDKLILFLVFENSFSATKETAREWINLHATSLCVAFCARNDARNLLLFILNFGNATSCTCEKIFNFNYV